MVNYAAFRIFLVCLIACASMVLVAIWIGKDAALGEAYFKTTASFFVVGLASFLIWFSTTLLMIRKAVQKK